MIVCLRLSHRKPSEVNGRRRSHRFHQVAWKGAWNLIYPVARVWAKAAIRVMLAEFCIRVPSARAESGLLADYGEISNGSGSISGSLISNSLNLVYSAASCGVPLESSRAPSPTGGRFL